MFDTLIEKQNKRFQSNITRLNQYINQSPNIKTFIELVLSNDRSHSKWEDYIPGQLHLFMYDLGYSLDNIHSEHNLNLNWSTVLIEFIGNYFLDDAYFNLKKENGVWRVYADEDGIQDPQALITAAKENAEYYWNCDLKFKD